LCVANTTSYVTRYFVFLQNYVEWHHCKYNFLPKLPFSLSLHITFPHICFITVHHPITDTITLDYITLHYCLQRTVGLSPSYLNHPRGPLIINSEFHALLFPN
jgi:hypothetical protein